MNLVRNLIRAIRGSILVKVLKGCYFIGLLGAVCIIVLIVSMLLV